MSQGRSMISIKNTVMIFVAVILNQSAYSMTVPNPQFTMGVLCTQNDPNFRGFDYPVKVARCNRNIGQAEKSEVAKNYGNIPQSEWANYEFDHYLPLCAGGSNDIHNLWPQPISEAKQKDVIEVQVCTAMKAGTMTQDQALQKIHEWFASLNQQKKTASSNASMQFVQSFTETVSTYQTQSVECLEVKTADHKDLESKLKINFDFIDENTISNLKVQLTEKNGENEFLNATEKKIRGKMTRAQSGPLANLLLYAVQNNHDRFDLYLPQKINSLNSKQFNGQFKISFEDSYPRLVQLSCEIK